MSYRVGVRSSSHPQIIWWEQYGLPSYASAEKWADDNGLYRNVVIESEDPTVESSVKLPWWKRILGFLHG